jgi:hypothetical protein
MIETADGQILRLTGARARRLGARAGVLGLAGLMRRHHRGDLARAFGRTVRELARGARRAGHLIGRRTGRRYLVFEALDGDQRFRLVGRPLDDGTALLVDARALGAASVGAEREDGDGARRANLEVLRAIWGIPATASYADVQRAWDEATLATRGGMAQVRADGKITRRNRPDRSYLAPDGQRINVEVDTNPDSARDHLARLRRFDPRAVNYALIVDQNTGRVIEARVARPGQRPQSIPAPASIEAVGLPAAQRTQDPSLVKKSRQQGVVRRAAGGGSVFRRGNGNGRRAAPPARGRGSRESELDQAAAALEQELSEATSAGAGGPDRLN